MLLLKVAALILFLHCRLNVLRGWNNLMFSQTILKAALILYYPCYQALFECVSKHFQQKLSNVCLSTYPRSCVFCLGGNSCSSPSFHAVQLLYMSSCVEQLATVFNQPTNQNNMLRDGWVVRGGPAADHALCPH